MARKPALGFIFVTVVLDILGIGLIVPILPKLVKELQGGVTNEAAYIYGLLVAIYSLMQFVFAPLLGNLSDVAFIGVVWNNVGHSLFMVYSLVPWTENRTSHSFLILSIDKDRSFRKVALPQRSLIA